jgi:hypothetical protein
MINMTMSGRDRETVRLLPHLIMMNQTLDMTLFTITNWSLTQRDSSNLDEGIMMTVVMKRKIAKEILTTFVPTTLLMMITISTVFFKPQFFEAALGTNLTTMLMMTTIFMEVMAMLPSTNYVKHIDIWLIGCQLVPFIEVLLLTAIEGLREEGEEGRANPPPLKVPPRGPPQESPKATPATSCPTSGSAATKPHPQTILVVPQGSEQNNEDLVSVYEDKFKVSKKSILCVFEKAGMFNLS